MSRELLTECLLGLNDSGALVALVLGWSTPSGDDETLFATMTQHLTHDLDALTTRQKIPIHVEALVDTRHLKRNTKITRMMKYENIIKIKILN